MKKKNIITTPHDAIFRHHLSRLDTARDFMELHLPDHLKSVCDLNTLLERLVTLLVNGYTDEQQLTALLNYMLLAGEARNPGALIATLAKRAPKHEGMLMTIAEKLREEGRLEGLLLGERKGEQLGEEKGRAEAKIEVARSLLAMSVPLAVIVRATGLSEDQLRGMAS